MRHDIPRIIGHRGAAGQAPENTLAGFRKAHALGCRWVEFDCMLSQDDVVVIHHDDRVNRTTNGSGLVSSLDAATIRQLDAGSRFSPDYAGCRVPDFTETLALLTELGMGANVEIKPVTGHDRQTGLLVTQAILAQWPDSLPPPVVSSFSLDALAESHAVAPDLDRAVLWERVPKDWQDHHERLGASAIHVSARHLTREQAQQFQATDVPFRCYTVNDPKVAQRLFDWGCQAIFTDYPDRFSDCLA